MFQEQHLNCLVQSAYIVLQDEIHKQDLESGNRDHTPCDLNEPRQHETMHLECQPTPFDDYYLHAKAECDDRLFKLTAENQDSIQEKEAECKAKITLRETGCRKRVALKEMGCEFALAMKDGDFSSRMALKELECPAMVSASWTGWETTLSTVKDGMEERVRNATATAHNWFSGKMEEFFGSL